MRCQAESAARCRSTCLVCGARGALPSTTKRKNSSKLLTQGAAWPCRTGGHFALRASALRAVRRGQTWCPHVAAERRHLCLACPAPAPWTGTPVPKASGTHPGPCTTQRASSPARARKRMQGRAEKADGLFLSTDRPQPAFPLYEQQLPCSSRAENGAIVTALRVTVACQAGRRHHPKGCEWPPTFPAETDPVPQHWRA